MRHRFPTPRAADRPTGSPARRRGLATALLLAVPLAVSACHLLDQTDFEPKRAAVPAPPPIPDPETRPALVTIEYTTKTPDYAADLGTAIQAVETRRPGSLYDVVAVVADGAAAPAARLRAADVMTAIEAHGVNPARVQLGEKIQPGLKNPQVRVYLR